MISKRYKDIFGQYIYKNEKTPLTIGTLVVCALCFLMLLISIFTKITFSHPWFDFKNGFEIISKVVDYGPQTPVMVLIIYILRQNFSLLTFIIYLLVGFFVWPIFVFGGGLEYFHNYLFGYMLGFIFAIFIAEAVLKNSQNLKSRILMAILSVLTMHLCGFLYCIILALFKIIDFGLIFQIVKATSGSKIVYDILFSILVVIVAPYIKNVLWVCMKPKPDRQKKSKYVRKRNQIIGDDVN